MLIGITGTDGSGKGSAVSYLVEKFNFTHYSVRDLILSEVQKRKLEPIRINLRLVGNIMREEEGADVVVKKALEKIKADKIENAVIESIRATKEVETLKQAGGILLAVDAPVEIRYKRVLERGSETDRVSFAEFIKHEELEMDDPNPNGMQKRQVMAMADYTISNSKSLSDLHSSVNEFLAKYNFSS